MKNFNLYVLACFILTPLSVHAHEVVQAYAIGVRNLQSFVSLDSTYAGFNFGGYKGTYLTEALSGNFMLNDDIALGARLPFHTLWRDGSPRSSSIGDADFTFRYRLFHDHSGLTLFGGTSGEFPIGNESRGISSGHGELSPFLTLQTGNDKVFYYATLAGVFALSGRHAGDYTFNFVAPHADIEVQYNFGALYAFNDEVYASLGLGGFSALKNDPYFGGSSFYIAPGFG